MQVGASMAVFAAQGEVARDQQVLNTSQLQLGAQLLQADETQQAKATQSMTGPGVGTKVDTNA